MHHPIHPWALAVGIEEAHRLGLPVLGHLRPSTWLAAARLGSDFIEHGFSIRTDRARFKALLAANVTMTESPVGNDPRSSAELDVLHPSAREYYLRNRSAKDPDAPITEPRGPGLAVAFAKAGGRVVVGSDRGGVPRIPSFSHSNSVRLLHDGLGFSELEAVRVATFSGARALGIDKRTGTVEEEKEADLVVLRGDPATRMAGIGNIDMALPQRTVVRPGSATCANERAVRVAVASRRREDAAVHEMQVKLQ